MPADQIIAEYGLPALLAGAALEGETVVVMAGVAVHRGILPFWPAIAAASTGSFAADQLFFLLGRRYREHAFVRKAQATAAFAKALATFDRHPTLFVFAFRFLYGLRTISPLAIGTTQLPARRFLLINAAAAIAWGAAFVTLGFYFGTAVEGIFGRLRSPKPIFLAIAATGLVLALIVTQARRRQSAQWHTVEPVHTSRDR